MDDFLYNLRRESDKRNRRQSGQQNYRGPDRRGPNTQRRPYQKRYDASEHSAEIKTLLETIAENQKQLAENDNRKIHALEDIADALQSLLGAGISPIKRKKAETVSPSSDAVESEAPEVPGDSSRASADTPELHAEAAETSGEKEPSVKADADQSTEKPLRSTHEEIRKIALSLREQGKTYKEIAQYLDDNKIPTFSGKGGWHAPTIHKLCK